MAPADTPACWASVSRVNRARWRSRRRASPIESGPSPRSGAWPGAGFVTTSTMSLAMLTVSAFGARTFNPGHSRADAHDLACPPTNGQHSDRRGWDRGGSVAPRARDDPTARTPPGRDPDQLAVGYETVSV